MNFPKKYLLTLVIGLVLLTTISAKEEEQKSIANEDAEETKNPSDKMQKLKGLYENVENHPKISLRLTKRTGRSCLNEWWKSIKEKAGSFVEKLPNPIQNLFKRKNETEKSEEDNTEKEGKKESGTLDILGRGLVRDVGKGISKALKTVKDTIGFKASNVSGGLDSNKTFFDGIASQFQNKLKAIFPGTKWCGDGNKARSDQDVGVFEETDKCCRQHDKCPDNIPAGETRHGLFNTGLFTRSNCACDREFHNCLNSSSEIVSKKIGFTFFTILGPQCFKQYYPIIDCLKSDKGKCVDYKFDTSAEKIYQWFDSPTFIKLF